MTKTQDEPNQLTLNKQTESVSLSLSLNVSAGRCTTGVSAAGHAPRATDPR